MAGYPSLVPTAPFHWLPLSGTYSTIPLATLLWYLRHHSIGYPSLVPTAPILGSPHSGTRGHHAAPLSIAEDGDDDIEGVEGGLEGDVLIEVEAAGDDVDDNPDEPLLQVLACQGPDAHEGERCGEGVGQGHTRVGAGDEERVECCPGQEGEYTHPQPLPKGVGSR